MAENQQLTVANPQDIVIARLRARDFAVALGFNPPETILITSAIAELGRNILAYATAGTLRLQRAEDSRRHITRVGLTIRAQDRGPGIADVQRALLGGYSTSGRLGVGLSGVRRIMDDVSVTSGAGRGTTVIATKWRGAQSLR